VDKAAGVVEELGRFGIGRDIAGEFDEVAAV
jgi:hypothetical protein